jgi:hypothetical protein
MVGDSRKQNQHLTASLSALLLLAPAHAAGLSAAVQLLRC